MLAYRTYCIPSKDIDVPGLEGGRTMTRSKRGSRNLAFDLNNTDGNASSRSKRPIPETKIAATETLDTERSKLLGEKQGQLTKVTMRHDALVCHIFFSFLVPVFMYMVYRSGSFFIWKTLP